jgi:hypothetical protein
MIFNKLIIKFGEATRYNSHNNNAPRITVKQGWISCDIGSNLAFCLPSIGDQQENAQLT